VRRLLLVGLLLLAVPDTAGAKPLTVGTGQNGGIAIDDAGTVYVGWQINTYDPGDAVQFCILPPRATACASQVTIPFPGQGYNRSRVSVLLPAPNTVDVIVPRTNGRGANSYLARSLDGGHSFARAVAISGDGFSEAVQGPGGRIALADGPTTLRAGLFAADGSSVHTVGSALGPFLEGVFNDVAASGEEVLAAGSDANTTHAFRLGAGGDPNQPGAWQQLDPARGEDPQLAGLPGGFAVLLEPSDHTPNLFVQRLEGAAWSPPVPVAPEASNTDFTLAGSPRGRLTALIVYSAYHLHYATSTDGGVLWSSVVDTANYGGEYTSDLESAVNASGAGAAVVSEPFGAKRVRVSRFTPRSAPVARTRLRRAGARVQVRSLCDGDKLSLVVEAARGNRRVAPASVLKRARFGRAAHARRGFRSRFRARYTLRRRHARIPVGVIPRRGQAHTLRLRVRRCGATR
jgi:hypothetical protein